jgi:sec-independent protein translocase protein TatA
MSFPLAIFGPIGLPEMLIILVIIMLIFGASRLPEIGKGIGQGIKNFKTSLKDADNETKQS